MATAGVNRMILWTDLEGRELLGRWRLGSLVRPEGRTAWFTATSEGRALMLSITETLNDDEELLERLNAAARIRHPNVVALEEARAAYVDDTPVVIAAMEPTDENLGDVLRERTLQAMEAQQVLRALVQGLAAIHAQGLVHGRMEPASVLAMGDTVKLRSDCLQLGGTEFAARCAEDVRGLGRIVTQSMTGRAPAGENDPLLQLLTEPMARAVRRALSGNASISEIAALVGGVTLQPVSVPEPKPAARVGPVPVPAPMPVASDSRGQETARNATDPATPVTATATASALPAGSAEVSVAPLPKPASKLIALPAAERVAEKPKPLKQSIESVKDDSSLMDDEPMPLAQRRSAPLVMAIAALLVIATLWALYGMLHSGRSASATRTASTPPPAASAVPNPPKPAVVTPAVHGSAAAAVTLTAPGWRVVAYTYRREAQAEHKAQLLRQQYPQLGPGVFALHGSAPYLVTLGGVMSKADAFGLRNKAVQMGLPRDTYAQNYR